MWHHALFSASFYPGEESDFMRPFWRLLMRSGADLVLSGHAHSYERFAPQTDEGVADPNGIREFVSGAGGEDHRSIFDFPRRANLEAGADLEFGVLRLQLGEAGYSWDFLPTRPLLFHDRGSAACH
jgi:hypothetical protein